MDLDDQLQTAIRFHQQGQLQEAWKLLSNLVRSMPNEPEVFHHIGVIAGKLGEIDTAVQALRMAIRLRPSHAIFHANLGVACSRASRHRDAIEAFREAIKLDPSNSTTWSGYFYSLQYLTTITDEERFREHCRFGERFSNRNSEPQFDKWDGRRPIRIGYVSPDFRNHSVAKFVKPILENHNRQRFSVTCYSEVTRPDDITKTFQSLSDCWFSTVGLTTEQLSSKIRSDRIDILIDLAGHTANNRLDVFARRSAPVQMTWLGYDDTTGLPTMDYFITDEVVHPSDQQSWHTERLLRLPLGCACFSPPIESPVHQLMSNTSKSQKMTSGTDRISETPDKPFTITFGSLHRIDKLTDEVFDLWSAVMRAIPQSRLLVFWPTLERETISAIQQQMFQRGVNQNRIELRSQLPEGENYLSVYREIDIALDVLPWSGRTTNCEALCMGSLVIGLSGTRPSSRGAAGILASISLEELVAKSVDEYVEIAQQLAQHPQRLLMLRRLLPERLSKTLCNGARFTRTLESAFEESLKEKWERKNSE